MAKIKIDDLPEDKKISKEEIKRVMGGVVPGPLPYPLYDPKSSIYLRGDYNLEQKEIHLKWP